MLGFLFVISVLILRHRFFMKTPKRSWTVFINTEPTFKIDSLPLWVCSYSNAIVHFYPIKKLSAWLTRLRFIYKHERRILIPGLRSRSRKESELDFFVRLWFQMSSWIIFYITLLNWEFLLKRYNFFWKFCWNRDFLLCTTISIDFNSQISLLLCGVGAGNFGKVGVGNFGKSESELLERSELESDSDILPPTPQPCY